MSDPVKANRYRINRHVQQEIRPWWFATAPPVKAAAIKHYGYELRQMENRHLTILKTTAWGSLPGPAGDLYAEFMILNPEAGTGKWTDGEAARQFWLCCDNQSIVQGILKSPACNGKFNWARRVFVNLDFAGHFGLLFFRLTSRTPSVNSLLIHAYGVRNGVPCHCCAKSFQKFAGSREDNVRSMHPYFECVSLPGNFNNRCSNCMFAESAAHCDYEQPERWSNADSGVAVDDGIQVKRKKSGEGVRSLIPPDVRTTNVDICMLSDLVKEAKRDMLGKYKGIHGGASFILDDHPWLGREQYQRLTMERESG